MIAKPFEVGVEAVNCHHNYVQKETHFGASIWVTRKGAVSAQKGEMGIIPGSMGAKSYIVRGLGACRTCTHLSRPVFAAAIFEVSPRFS